MKKFTDDLEIQDKIDELLRLHKSYVIDNMEEQDPEVESQKTRVFNFGCWLKYGHLIGKSGVCKRCGKRLTSGK
jgi:hypothetical protein